MKFRTFQHNYHDGSLVSFTLGPRRELTLEVELDPIWNSQRLSARVRFGGIENYDAVADYFRALPLQRSGELYITGIMGLEYSRQELNSVILDLDNYGHVIIRSKHITEL